MESLHIEILPPKKSLRVTIIISVRKKCCLQCRWVSGTYIGCDSGNVSRTAEDTNSKRLNPLTVDALFHCCNSKKLSKTHNSQNNKLGLEDEFPFWGPAYFQGPTVSFMEGKTHHVFFVSLRGSSFQATFQSFEPGPEIYAVKQAGRNEASPC